MHELVRTDGSGSQTVDARELHAALGVGKDFSTWIKDRIEKYGFIEGGDYHVFDSPNLGNQTGRGGDRRSINYALSISTAKEIAMVENSDQGRRIRRYLIADHSPGSSGSGFGPVLLPVSRISRPFMIRTSSILFLVLCWLAASSSTLCSMSGGTLMLICSFPINKLSARRKKD